MGARERPSNTLTGNEHEKTLIIPHYFHFVMIIGGSDCLIFKKLWVHFSKSVANKKQ